MCKNNYKMAGTKTRSKTKQNSQPYRRPYGGRPKEKRYGKKKSIVSPQGNDEDSGYYRSDDNRQQGNVESEGYYNSGDEDSDASLLSHNKQILASEDDHNNESDSENERMKRDRERRRTAKSCAKTLLSDNNTVVIRRKKKRRKEKDVFQLYIISGLRKFLRKDYYANSKFIECDKTAYELICEAAESGDFMIPSEYTMSEFKLEYQNKMYRAINDLRHNGQSLARKNYLGVYTKGYNVCFIIEVANQNDPIFVVT